MENTKAKRKPVVVSFIIAIAIGIICLVVYLCKFYQPELEMPPKIIVTDSSGQKKELLLVSYDWTYKGETKTFDMKIGEYEDIIKYNYDIDNIFFTDWNLSDMMTFKTEPEYKNNGFISKRTWGIYDSADEIYYGGADVNKIEPGVEFKLSSYSSGTNFIEITLNSDKQGNAIYLLKAIDATNFPLEKMKKDTLSKNAEDIEKYLKDTEFGYLLNNVNVEENKLVLTFDYWISDDRSSNISAILFTLLNDVNEIEYNFLHNKFIEKDYNYETAETETFNFDKAEPVIHYRDRFITKDGLKISELQAYIND